MVLNVTIVRIHVKKTLATNDWITQLLALEFFVTHFLISVVFNRKNRTQLQTDGDKSFETSHCFYSKIVFNIL